MSDIFEFTPKVQEVELPEEGEIWFAILPGHIEVDSVEIIEITRRTVLVQKGNWCVRFRREDVEFLERLDFNYEEEA